MNLPRKPILIWTAADVPQFSAPANDVTSEVDILGSWLSACMSIAARPGWSNYPLAAADRRQPANGLARTAMTY
jgi:hypothetical protein